MRVTALLTSLSSWLGLVAAVAIRSSNQDCSRQCMTSIVTEILDSMVAHDPSTLPLASVYRATENSHPAALTMMTSWRTIEAAGAPSLLAIDVKNGTAYFALDVSEGNVYNETILRGRIAVVNQEITELELFINRYRGDHGFSFSATELPSNYAPLMSPPANRTRATRDELMFLSNNLFAVANSTVAIGTACQFTEMGWIVIDRGNYGNGTTDPIACGWPPVHPFDVNARAGLVVDEELGFVVTSGIVPGKVFAEENLSAFIPDVFTDAQDAQVKWFNETEGQFPLLYPFGASADTLEVLQYYDGGLKAMQINIYLSGPGMTSPWLS